MKNSKRAKTMEFVYELSSSVLSQFQNLRTFLLDAPKGYKPEVNNLQSVHIEKFALINGEQISCINYRGDFFMTGTDIVRILECKLEIYGRPIVNFKKFEEGVFSDLRNLKPGYQSILSEPRTDLLEILFRANCVRTQKKQKLFAWYAIPHDKLLLDAVERDMKREKKGLESTTNLMFENEVSFRKNIIFSSDSNCNEGLQFAVNVDEPSRIHNFLTYDYASLKLQSNDRFGHRTKQTNYKSSSLPDTHFNSFVNCRPECMSYPPLFVHRSFSYDEPSFQHVINPTSPVQDQLHLNTFEQNMVFTTDAVHQNTDFTNFVESPKPESYVGFEAINNYTMSPDILSNNCTSVYHNNINPITSLSCNSIPFISQPQIDSTSFVNFLPTKQESLNCEYSESTNYNNLYRSSTFPTLNQNKYNKPFDSIPEVLISETEVQHPTYENVELAVDDSYTYSNLYATNLNQMPIENKIPSNNYLSSVDNEMVKDNNDYHNKLYANQYLHSSYTNFNYEVLKTNFSCQPSQLRFEL